MTAVHDEIRRHYALRERRLQHTEDRPPMTVRELIALLQTQPPDAAIYIWDPLEEVSGIPLRVQDIYQPTDGTETFIVAEFG